MSGSISYEMTEVNRPNAEIINNLTDDEMVDNRDNDIVSEIQDIERTANKAINSTLDSTRRMLTLCEESNEAGLRTVVALDEQGEQLDRVEKDMDNINCDMRETEKHLTDMEKVCGLCLCPCGKSKKFKEDPNAWHMSANGGIVVEGQPQKIFYSPLDTRPNGKRGGSAANVETVGYIKRIVVGDPRETEMENNMVVVNQLIGNLRNMAIDIGGEISTQNNQLDRLNLKGDSNQTRIQEANERAQRLLY